MISRASPGNNTEKLKTFSTFDCLFRMHFIVAVEIFFTFCIIYCIRCQPLLHIHYQAFLLQNGEGDLVRLITFLLVNFTNDLF